ncbi:MAG: DinB family protein, partial [Gammaproteobacteria bacterium]|nr:DinB family protein [Gammaproteobacteria bacterium]
MPTAPDQYRDVRTRTIALCKSLETEDYVVQSMPDASPAKWHLAHTTWFFERFVLQESVSAYRAFDDSYDYLFNSYYYTAGLMHPRAQRGVLSRPLLREILNYREQVDQGMQRLLESASAEVVQRTVLGLNHEQQHQELLLTDIKHLFSRNPALPAVDPELPVPPSAPPPELSFVVVEGGIYEIGHSGDGFCFDNETPRHPELL